MSQSTVKKIPNNYFDGMPVTGFHKIVFFIIMMAYFCEQMDNWNFGFIAPALMHTWGLQMSDIGVVTLWYFIGMTAGGFFGGVISDFIGRRKTFLISIATFSFFSVLNGFTDNFHVFVIARSMTGFGVFCLMVCSQAYIAEMAPAESRGKWQNLVAAVGFSAVPVIGVMCRAIIPLAEEAWRFIFYFGGVVLTAVVMAMGFTVFSYTAESYPTRMRNTATGFHSSTGRLAVAAAQPLIPMAYAAYSFDGVFWIFSFLCFVPAVVIAIWGQRTGGKSLEEIA